MKSFENGAVIRVRIDLVTHKIQVPQAKHEAKVKKDDSRRFACMGNSHQERWSSHFAIL